MLLNSTPDTVIQNIIAYSAIVLLAFPLHEFAHAWASTQLGDRTAFYQGRLTLDPRAHIDPFGAILLAVSFIGWAKPVPFVPSNLRKAPSIKIGIALVAVAGPLMNILIAAIAAIPLRIGGPDFLFSDSPIVEILFLIVSINLYLAFFNLIPLAPLDGSKVLLAVIPDSWLPTYNQIQQYSTLILFALILLPRLVGSVNILFDIINPPVQALLRLLIGF